MKSAGAYREIGVLIGELACGNLGALRGSYIMLANRTGWIEQLMQATLGGTAFGSLFGFSGGGYTGHGGKYEPKGVVHGGEAAHAVVNKAIRNGGMIW